MLGLELEEFVLDLGEEEVDFGAFVFDLDGSSERVGGDLLLVFGWG